ncbi:MAG: hypothetical protein MI862_08735 [Desulfobacterales bacterium]|nr:hypothetical protein [Desulfobacterales bacterium]
MKLIIGGSIAIILSIVGFAYSFPEFLKFLAGSIPVMLLLGGGVALYLYREMRYDESIDIDEPDAAPEPPAPPAEEKTAPPDMEVAEADAPAEAPGTVVEKEAPAEEEAKPEAAVEDAPAGDTVEAAPVEAPAAPEEAGVIGNEESKVFHRPECQYAKSKKCTASFATAGDALAAGYKACGVCKPTG